VKNITEAEIGHLGVIYNAIVSDSLEWAFAHMDRLSEYDVINNTLNKYGFFDMAQHFEHAFILFNDLAETIDGPTANLNPDQAYNALMEIEDKGRKSGIYALFKSRTQQFFI